MPDLSTGPNFPVNPRYGQGLFRRRIRLEGREGAVFAALEDTNHGFCVTVHHDGSQVTAIAPEARRVPFDTCPQAGTRLQTLIGCDIHDDSRSLNLLAGASSNCTHWLDLTILAIRHATAGNTVRVWDVTVSDETDAADSEAVVYRDGEEILRWQARNFLITQPLELVGKPLYFGFGRWVNGYFDAATTEAAFILQKGYFVAQARRYDLDALAGRPASDSRDSMLGACFTYSADMIDRARRSSRSIRDFSDTPEQLLRFE